MEKGKVSEKAAKGFLRAASAVALASAMGVKVDGIITRIAKIFVYFGWFAFFVSLLTYIGAVIRNWGLHSSLFYEFYSSGLYLTVGFWVLVICYLIASLWILTCKVLMWVFASTIEPSKASDLASKSRDSNRIDELEKRIKELESEN